MNGTQTRNLDLLAAGTANAVVDALVVEEGPKRVKHAKSLENIATKALGVFQENGVYAGVLFLLSTSQDAKKANAIAEALTDLTGQLSYGWATPAKTPATILAYYSNTVCDHLDRLLLVKGLFEQTLTYVRYAAKAQQQEGKAQQPESPIEPLPEATEEPENAGKQAEEQIEENAP